MTKMPAKALFLALLCSTAGIPAVSPFAGKLMMGYQGWFLCKGDSAPPNEWRHWFRSLDDPSGTNLSVDLWPDISELGANELYATNLVLPDGSPAKLYSAWNEATVVRHFKWMADYGIDGVYLQRFTCELGDPRFYSVRNKVTASVMKGAAQHGRLFAIMYDISNQNAASLVPTITNDWKRLVDSMLVTQNPACLTANGLPVVCIWGLGFTDRPGSPAQADSIIDFFKNASTTRYRTYLIGGVPGQWRTIDGDSKNDPAWRSVYARFDMLTPWSVGRFNNNAGADDFLRRRVTVDLDTVNRRGQAYMPVIWPGFSWKNLQNGTLNQIPRRGGAFIWHQAYNVLSAGCDNLYVAMFDEVDEATAMFKVAPSAATAPQGFPMLTLDADGYALPSDWYLRVAGELGRMARGDLALRDSMSIDPTRATKVAPSLKGNSCVVPPQGHYDAQGRRLLQTVPRSGIHRADDLLRALKGSEHQ